MGVNPSIFKSYDIRGIYPSELNEQSAVAIGRAFVRKIRAGAIVLGRDMRLSSPNLFEALAKGITSQGAHVRDIGLVPTECVYFSVGHYGYDAGIMITASHNPKEYNGFKMVKRKKDGNEIDMIRGKDVSEIDVQEKNDGAKPIQKGTIKKIDIWKDYLKHIFSFIDLNEIKPFRAVIDAGNGMAGKVIPLLEDRLPVEIIPLNFELDGSFPAHPSNPLHEGSSDQIKESVKKEKADLGFIFDGDADRVYLIDEKGNFVSADISLLFLARQFLEKNPGAGIVYNLICSKAVPQFIKKWGGRPIRSKVGFVNVREEMMKQDGVMGGELSGHYSFKDNLYLDSGFISFLLILQIISRKNKPVSELVSEVSLYQKAPELNFEVEDKEKILESIKKEHAGGKQDYLDGVTVEYPDWWFNVRASQTEPLLRLTVEADTAAILEEKKRGLKDFIEKQG